jgi:hypothetical protein
VTSDLQRQRDEAAAEVARCVRGLEIAGYPDGAIAAALMGQFRRLTVLHCGGDGSAHDWIFTLASMIAVAVEEAEAEEEPFAPGEDAIAVLMADEGLTFIEAVERLARERRL